MAIILQIETATQVCSAALSKDGKTIAIKEQMANNIHAGSLTLFIQEVMGTAGLKFTDIDAVAISKGPGSYTGLRIGVSTAKGLCYALDKPLISVSTLQMMAEGYLSLYSAYKGYVCSMIDARRMEVFTAVFNSDLEVVLPAEAKIIDQDSFKELLAANELTFIGNGALKCADTITEKNASFCNVNFNSAGNMSSLASKAFNSGSFEDVAYFEPFYLKDFVLTTPKKK